MIALVVFISVLVLVAAYLTYGRFLALSFSLLALAVWLKHSGRRIGFMLLPLAVMLVLSLFLLIETVRVLRRQRSLPNAASPPATLGSQ